MTSAPKRGRGLPNAGATVNFCLKRPKYVETGRFKKWYFIVYGWPIKDTISPHTTGHYYFKWANLECYSPKAKNEVKYPKLTLNNFDCHAFQVYGKTC